MFVSGCDGDDDDEHISQGCHIAPAPDHCEYLDYNMCIMGHRVHTLGTAGNNMSLDELSNYGWIAVGCDEAALPDDDGIAAICEIKDIDAECVNEGNASSMLHNSLFFAENEHQTSLIAI